MDDETSFLDTVRALFTAWSKNGWRIESATSADQALEILKTRKFDLIVVDVNMPVLDGIQFLRILNRRYPDLKKAAITGHTSEEKRSACLANGAELFIEKPRSADGLKSIFTMLDELITWRPQSGFRGMLRQVGLQDVIQMECLGRNSSILEVQDRQMTGRIYIEDGRIVHADAGEIKGEPAFQKLLSLAGGSFQLQHFEPPTERTIEGQWEFLLMEAARVRDETAGATPAAEPATEMPPESEPSAAIAISGNGVSPFCARGGDIDLRRPGQIALRMAVRRRERPRGPPDGNRPAGVPRGTPPAAGKIRPPRNPAANEPRRGASQTQPHGLRACRHGRRIFLNRTA